MNSENPARRLHEGLASQGGGAESCGKPGAPERRGGNGLHFGTDRSGHMGRKEEVELLVAVHPNPEPHGHASAFNACRQDLESRAGIVLSVTFEVGWHLRASSLTARYLQS
jgi:hypothetical protein